MPYIKSDRQKEISDALNIFKDSIGPIYPGDLAFIFTKLILIYIPEYNYGNMAAITGILETVKLEFYRRILGPYEDTKKEQNGDVFLNET